MTAHRDLKMPLTLARVEKKLNLRPRITLGDKTPADLFQQLLA